MIVERPVAPPAPVRSAVAVLRPAPEPTTGAAPLDSPPSRHSRWQATHNLACHRAETERVKILVDFLARPICAPGGTDPDPDILTAYNLAVEAALGGIRRASQSVLR